jgi:multidrug efflux pump subunit AcrB
MVAYNISADEVVAALRAQNVEAAPGRTGESSGRYPQSVQYILRYTGKVNEKSDYEEIVLRAEKDGKTLKLKDIAEVEFGTVSYDMVSKSQGRPAASIMLKQRPGSNAREVIRNVKQRMEELQATIFPPNIEYNYAYDISRFLDASMAAVLRTLLEAFLLVFIVVFLFLQDFRSTFIPILPNRSNIKHNIISYFPFKASSFSSSSFSLQLAFTLKPDTPFSIYSPAYSQSGFFKIKSIQALRCIGISFSINCFFELTR